MLVAQLAQPRRRRGGRGARVRRDGLRPHSRTCSSAVSSIGSRRMLPDTAETRPGGGKQYGSWTRSWTIPGRQGESLDTEVEHDTSAGGSAGAFLLFRELARGRRRHDRVHQLAAIEQAEPNMTWRKQVEEARRVDRDALPEDLAPPEAFSDRRGTSSERKRCGCEGPGTDRGEQPHGHQPTADELRRLARSANGRGVLRRGTRADRDRETAILRWYHEAE